MKDEIIYKYLRGIASLEEKEQVLNWLNQDPQNRELLKSYSDIYEAQVWYGNTQKESEDFVSTIPNKKEGILRLVMHRWVQLAAVFILGFFVHFLTVKEKPEVSGMLTFHAPQGQRAEITLEDGTHVWLNANSTLSYPRSFVNDKRLVKLCGEAYFDVTHNEEKPFIVSVGEHQVKVLGTEFNIEAYKTDFFETSLIEGSVLFSTPGCKDIKLVPNTAVTIQKGLLKVQPIRFADHFDWRKGLLCFEELTVEDIFRKLELYYDIQIEVKNKLILKEKYSGKFRIRDGVEHVFNVLQVNNHFNYQISEDRSKVIIL